jgi:hypothetical protein
MAHHLHSALPPSRSKRPELSSRIVSLVEHLTAKDPNARPQSYAALRKAIEDSVEPLQAWTSGSPYRGLAAFDFEHAPIFFGR